MREDALQHFVCPWCHRGLVFEHVAARDRDRIKEAILVCQATTHRFQVIRFVPRFVVTHETTASFGFEWNKHPRTQLDSVNGMGMSEERFFRETNWPRNLSKQKVLEVGSGAGRFTEIALQTGAQVFAIDSSAAVDANFSNNGSHPNLVLCQASLYELPFLEGYFDKVFCFGVLQHTPNVRLAFSSIAKYVRPGGELAVDVYNKEYWRNFHTPIYLIRPIAKRIPHDKLYRIVSWVVPRLLPFSTRLQRIPFVGNQLSALLPISNYDGVLPTDSREIIEQYSCLDTFDTLSPEFISPQRPDTAYQWFRDAGYEDIEFDRMTTFSMRGRRQLP